MFGTKCSLDLFKGAFLIFTKGRYLQMKKDIKTSQIIIRTSDAQKEFLQQQADAENRTITAIINIALSEKYPKYKKIFKESKGE